MPSGDVERAARGLLCRCPCCPHPTPHTHTPSFTSDQVAYIEARRRHLKGWRGLYTRGRVEVADAPGPGSVVADSRLADEIALVADAAHVEGAGLDTGPAMLTDAHFA